MSEPVKITVTFPDNPSTSVVVSTEMQGVHSDGTVTAIMRVTQTDYDALDPPVPSVLYVISE